ncbi:hypothetical protein G9A89_010501 [Geosiphon pyriformis]|nr:hypothetical protein G9A89_010501 [Geosiphon pyriformis]
MSIVLSPQFEVFPRPYFSFAALVEAEDELPFVGYQPITLSQFNFTDFGQNQSFITDQKSNFTLENPIDNAHDPREIITELIEFISTQFKHELDHKWTKYFQEENDFYETSFFILGQPQLKENSQQPELDHIVKRQSRLDPDLEQKISTFSDKVEMETVVNEAENEAPKIEIKNRIENDPIVIKQSKSLHDSLNKIMEEPILNENLQIKPFNIPASVKGSSLPVSYNHWGIDDDNDDDDDDDERDIPLLGDLEYIDDEPMSLNHRKSFFDSLFRGKSKISNKRSSIGSMKQPRDEDQPRSLEEQELARARRKSVTATFQSQVHV